MKRNLKFLIGSLLLVGILAGCNKEKSVNDHYLSIQLDDTLLEEDYDAFSELLDENFKNKEETFNKIKEIAKGWGHATFKKMEIIEYDNGEMLIVYLTIRNDEVKITGVKVIPQEMADTVKELLEQNE